MAKTSSTSTGPVKKTIAKTAAAIGNAAIEKDHNEGKLMEFFCDQLKDIYWAENHIKIALPKMIKAAASPVLQAAFQDHLKATAGHISRLEQAFELLGKPVRGKKCEAIEGIVLEGESIIAETEPGTAVRDTGLILAAQKVEHYEIATYGGLAQLATNLGLTDVAQLLTTTLAEEKETDALLTEIAENSINCEAASE
ncbi:ferritin-like domain-containing protein [Chitinophaga pinensis]|uniref:Ferritin-like domain-containing protein n=1 Tax=Chitinophaga pinensis TaxID=79329 RepID=A0A5C6LUI6_9BACT|nr:ferritin-like domain-containing protein [Chitinophaga pinensis]TWW00150.1 ferritin-like domain-containing protein [Chitinophaga pinensis]